MTVPSLTKEFRKAAKPPRKKKGPPPVSIRLTETEYERLKHDAGVMTMAGYIRLTLFGEDGVAPHRKNYTRKQTSPSSELTMIGQMLGRLGESEIASSLSDISKAAKTGSLPVTPETENTINDACLAVIDMRDALITALRVKVQ